jgi:hypothetical protein
LNKEKLQFFQTSAEVLQGSAKRKSLRFSWNFLIVDWGC